MTQYDYIKDIAKYGLENDYEKLLQVLNELVDYSKKSNRINFAIQLQSILKESIRQHQVSGISIAGSPKHILREEEKELSDLILEKLTSDYRLKDLVCAENVISELQHFIKEHQFLDVLNKFELPVSNKVLFHGPSGCGKTLAAYVLAGELEKLMIVVNLGAIVSSKLGETSKNLAKIFKRAASEDAIIFIDEFDSLGKVRDYSQDHGEMKRVVNTILQLFDYLPKESIIIAATNQINMIDEALCRRFDLVVELEKPDEKHVKELIDKTLQRSNFVFKNKKDIPAIIKQSIGLSYYTIQRTLITAIKRSLFDQVDKGTLSTVINTQIWKELIAREQLNLVK
ncbi:MAG: ATP-binding protein [Dysgonamonadaceae bacterium]|jgi:AAA+ superfamily predicted ATPase|nr:ATP-binding protein [Dysgonamonadaceae bacterium]